VSDVPTFRPLVAADAEAFRRLRLEALERHPRFFGSSAAEERVRDLDFFRDRLVERQPGNVVYGAFVGAELAGIAGMYRGEGEHRRHRGTLWTVYVAPAHRGDGLAEGLLRALIAHARVHVDLLTGLVVSDNHRARAFYRRLGFSVSGVERKVLKFGDDYLDEEILVMDFTEERAGA
jgi:ribosomal protein S18 acetylase RimI-like enzyme